MAGDVLGAGEWPFGAPLGAVCRRERVAVPEALARSLEWLRARGPRAAAREGLFRRRADPHQVQLLRRRFQAPGPAGAPDRPPLDAATDPHTVRRTSPAPAPSPGCRERDATRPADAGREGGAWELLVHQQGDASTSTSTSCCSTSTRATSLTHPSPPPTQPPNVTPPRAPGSGAAWACGPPRPRPHPPRRPAGRRGPPA